MKDCYTPFADKDTERAKVRDHGEGVHLSNGRSSIRKSLCYFYRDEELVPSLYSKS